MSNATEKQRRKRRLLSLYKEKCFWCGRKMKVDIRSADEKVRANSFTVDELIPVSRGGKRRLDNQVPAHRICNEQRGNMVASEADIARHQALLFEAIERENKAARRNAR